MMPNPSCFPPVFFGVEYLMASGYSGFLDESGDFQGRDVVSIGSVFSPTAHFDNFDLSWEKCLKACGLEYLKASKALNSNKPLSPACNALGPAKRSKALLPFVSCIRKHLETVGGTAIDVAAFKRLGGEKQAIWHQNPHYLAFVRVALRFIQLTTARDKIMIVCDDSNRAVEMYHHYRRVKQVYPDARERFMGLSFVDDRFVRAAQAADLVAALVRMQAEREFLNKPYEFENLYLALGKKQPGFALARFEVAFADHAMLLQLYEVLRDAKSKTASAR